MIIKFFIIINFTIFTLSCGKMEECPDIRADENAQYDLYRDYLEMEYDTECGEIEPV